MSVTIRILKLIININVSGLTLVTVNVPEDPVSFAGGRRHAGTIRSLLWMIDAVEIPEIFLKKRCSHFYA